MSDEDFRTRWNLAINSQRRQIESIRLYLAEAERALQSFEDQGAELQALGSIIGSLPGVGRTEGWRTAVPQPSQNVLSTSCREQQDDIAEDASEDIFYDSICEQLKGPFAVLSRACLGGEQPSIADSHRAECKQRPEASFAGRHSTIGARKDAARKCDGSKTEGQHGGESAMGEWWCGSENGTSERGLKARKQRKRPEKLKGCVQLSGICDIDSTCTMSQCSKTRKTGEGADARGNFWQDGSEAAHKLPESAGADRLRPGSSTGIRSCGADEQQYLRRALQLWNDIQRQPPKSSVRRRSTLRGLTWTRRKAGEYQRLRRRNDFVSDHIFESSHGAEQGRDRDRGL